MIKTIRQLLLSIGISGAISAAATDISRSNIMFLDTDNGLSSDYVMGMAQDAKGHIWIATEGGLNRFDGHRFTTFTKENSGLSSNELNYLLADTSNYNIWIATQRDGLCRYDTRSGKIHHYSQQLDGLNTNDITHIAHSSSGSGIWLSHYHTGIQYFDPGNPDQSFMLASENISGDDLPSHVWCAADDGQGHLYIGHVFGGFSMIDLDTHECRNFRHNPRDSNSIPSDEVFALCIDSNGLVWIGTDNGAACYNPANGQFHRFTHRKNAPSSILPGGIRSIYQAADGDIWFATPQGVSILELKSHTFVNPAEFTFRNFTARQDLSELTDIRSIFQDRYGNMWLGSYRNGLIFIGASPRSLRRINLNDEYKGHSRRFTVWDLANDNDGNIWIACENQLLCRQGENTSAIALPSDLQVPYSHIRTIRADSQGRLWIGTTGAGAYAYDIARKQFTRINGTGKDVRSFCQDYDGSMLIGTVDGVYRTTGTNLTAIPDTTANRQMKGHIIQEIIRDRNGNLWIATFDKGISIFDPHGTLIANLDTDSGLPSNAVNHMYSDSQDRIWAATRNGAIMFTGTSGFTSVTPDHNTPTGQARAISEDKDGRIWISFDHGLLCILPGNGQLELYQQYGHHPLSSFMSGAVCTVPDGFVLFGSLNGLYEVAPALLSEQRGHVAPVISDLEVYNYEIAGIDNTERYVTDGKSISLPHDKNSFRLSFSVPDFSYSGETEYSYRMNGLDNEWHNCGNDRQMIFRNLPPGHYTFSLRARIHGQPWPETSTDFHITVQPPFYLSWWAITLYVIIAIASIIAVIKSYNRRMKLRHILEMERKDKHNKQMLNEERLRFYTNITHELRTPLTLIIGPLEDLSSDPQLPGKFRHKINVIHDSSIRLLNLINGILEFRKTETQNRRLSVSRGNLSALVRETGLRYKELNRNNRVNYIIDIDTPSTVMYYDADMITTILDNLLSNANKYTSEGTITLRLRTSEENGVRYTDISVTDTGHGISPEALSHIFERYYQAKSPYQASGSGIGLALVKNLAELHQATINVASEPDKGTSFTLRLLTDNIYPDALHGAEKPHHEEPQAEDTAQEDARPLLLVVEDDDDIREYVEASLADRYTVITASNGKEGLEITRQRLPAIIVSDIMMPVMDGIEMCRTIKNDIATSHIPIILLTAKDSMADKEEGYNTGADSYLTKPFSAKLLRSRLNNLTESRRKLATSLMSQMGLSTPADPPITVQATETINSLDRRFIEKITAIIETNAGMEKMDIAFIAGEMAMSHSTLYRKVKAVAGISINEFIRKVRLRMAAQKLKTGEHTVSEVSYMTGFSSVAYFRQCFKAEFGTTPSEYIHGSLTDNRSIKPYSITNDE